MPARCHDHPHARRSFSVGRIPNNASAARTAFALRLRDLAAQNRGLVPAQTHCARCGEDTDFYNTRG